MLRDSQIEQFGFLEANNHFQMSGGEFCGNAACAAARVISKTTGATEGEFTTSGYQGKVQFKISDENIQCIFSELKPIVTKIETDNGLKGTLIDLGGIIHFVLDSEHIFVNDKNVYTSVYKQVITNLNLQEYSAFGVIWQESLNGTIKIHPVVGVKGVNSLFYETACGSGTIATLISNDSKQLEILQPSGQKIFVRGGMEYGFMLSLKVG